MDRSSPEPDTQTHENGRDRNNAAAKDRDVTAKLHSSVQPLGEAVPPRHANQPEPDEPIQKPKPSPDQRSLKLGLPHQVKLAQMTYRGKTYKPQGQVEYQSPLRQKRQLTPGTEVTAPPTPVTAEGFQNLSIRNKQVIALLAAGALSTAGLVGAGIFSNVRGGRSQLLNQAVSELAVMGTEYDIKINQMGFGFRGQSDNATIINAAKLAAQGKPLSAGFRNQVKRILKNEIAARNIEYATLVGRDLKIIVNANANRAGQSFNPDGLVAKVFQNSQQIQTSGIVPWSELSTESPPLPEGIANADALIRYTVTPVKDPSTGATIAALISGDIVNGKSAIPEKTVQALGGGYSAVYLSRPDGQFVLATSLDRETSADMSVQRRKDFQTGKTTDVGETTANIPLSNTKLLERAAAAPGEIITGRSTINNNSYTVAIKSIPNLEGKPIALLVRGTPEDSLASLLANSILLQVVMAGLSLGAAAFLASLLGKTITRPLEQLQQVAREFANGNRLARAEVTSMDEIGQLAGTFNEMAEDIEASIQQIEQQEAVVRQEAERARVVIDVAAARARSIQEIDEIFDKALADAREKLAADRVVIYRFNPNWSGYISNESVGQGWHRALDEAVEDACIPQALLEAYQEGRVVPTDDVFKAGFHADHLQLMKQLQIKANLVVPVMRQDQLFGLLAAHHCSGSHQWQEAEIQFCKQLATQLGETLERVSFLGQVEEARLPVSLSLRCRFDETEQ